MPKNKTCKQFCKNIFLPERENVEIEFSKKINKPLPKINNNFAKILKKLYTKSCNDIYCKKTCKNNKKWLSSFTKKRKQKLIKEGAKSGCRDLKKEFPGFYTNL